MNPGGARRRSLEAASRFGVLACFLLAACSDPIVVLTPDQGDITPDAGDQDSGTSGDAGSPNDAGSTNDAGSSSDAGATNDAGSSSDAGSSCGTIACALNWEPRTPSNSPSDRRAGTMAYDPASTAVALFGGYETTAGSTRNGTTMLWNGSDWSTAGGSSPGARTDTHMEHLAGASGLVLFGGHHGDMGGNQGQTWTRVSGTWGMQSPSMEPTPRSAFAFAVDTTRNVAVLFGGNSGSLTNQTWEYDGSTWANVTPASGSPDPTQEARMAYDAFRQRMILFGGQTGSGYNADTWEWNGTAWSMVSTSNAPSARGTHGMVYHAGLQGILVFGGAASSVGTYTNDLWFFDGSDWVPMTPGGTAPSRRRQVQMAYDVARDEVVLYGGLDMANATLGDTWVLVRP